MSRALWLVPLFVWAEIILGATKPESNVLAIGPVVRLVRRADLPSLCGTVKPVEACTSFAGQVLHARCEPAGGSWRLTGRAQFVSVMHVLGPEHVPHERDHIADIVQAVAAHLEALAQPRFETEERCNEARKQAAGRFSRDMDEFKRASNAKRHPRK